MVNYTTSIKGDYIVWLIKHRKKFKNTKPEVADIIIEIFTRAILWSTTEQYKEMYEYICNSFDIDVDERAFVKRPKGKKKTKK